MVKSVSTQAELQYVCHVAMPCGGEDESLEIMYALMTQTPSPSRLRSLAAVVLGASPLKAQKVSPP